MAVVVPFASFPPSSLLSSPPLRSSWRTFSFTLVDLQVCCVYCCACPFRTSRGHGYPNPIPEHGPHSSTLVCFCQNLRLPCLVLSCLALSCLVLSCLVLFCLVLSCLVLSCLVLSCLVLSCLVLSCPVLSCLIVFIFA